MNMRVPDGKPGAESRSSGSGRVCVCAFTALSKLRSRPSTPHCSSKPSLEPERLRDPGAVQLRQSAPLDGFGRHKPAVVDEREDCLACSEYLKPQAPRGREKRRFRDEEVLDQVFEAAYMRSPAAYLAPLRLAVR